MRYAVLPAILLLALAPVAGAQDFKAARTAFEAAFKPARPAAEREAAILLLTGFDDRETVKLLLSGVPVSEGIVADGLARRREVDTEIDRIVQSQMLEDQRTHSSSDMAKLKELRKETADLRERIDAELAVLAAIETSLSTFISEGATAYLAGPALLDDKSPRVRELAAAALGAGGAAPAVKPLARALKDEDDRVRVAAARSLGRLRAAEATPDLIALISRSRLARETEPA